MPTKAKNQATETHTISVVDRNIKALLAQKKSEEDQQSWEEKLAIAITRLVASMLFIAIHLVLFGGWIIVNVGWIPGVPSFDPTLVGLTVMASIEAILLSVFILITQRRMMAQAERRADLTLQVSLLAEYEITRLITLNKQMAKALGVEEGHEPELEELAKDMAPETVLKKLEQHEKNLSNEKAGTDVTAHPGQNNIGEA